MNLRRVFIAALFSMFLLFGSCAQQDDTSVIKYDFFGQKPPGDTPEVFGPGIISTEDSIEFSCTFSPDGKEMYFTRRKDGVFGNRIFYVKIEPDGLTDLRLAPFAFDCNENSPGISPDGKKLFFGSKRPLPGKPEISEEGSIWVSERVGNEWGEPQFFRSGLMFVSVTKSGDLYSTDISLDEGEDGYSFIVKSPLVDGEYLEPVSVYGPEGQVNKGTHPCIAPDESYMIFDEVRMEGFGEADLYISYRKPDGNWTEAINLGAKINSESSEFGARISPEGRFIFFARYRDRKCDIYWVDAKIIETFRPEMEKYPEKTSDFPLLKGSYLGQKPPGDIPELFECRISPNVEIKGVPVFANNGGLLLFKGSSYAVDGAFIMEQKNGAWSQPETVLLLSQYEDRHFFLTPDKNRIFFTSRRPVHASGKQTAGPNIWVVENSDSGWSVPQLLKFQVNTDRHGYYYSTVTQEGALYFTRSPLSESDAVICRSELENGQYTAVENLGETINSEYFDADPFIAPDESYLIFSSDKPRGDWIYDFYISFQKKDGSWTEPKNLGKNINSDGNDVCSLVTSDSRFFFFASNRTGNYEIYWVDANFIDRLKPKEIK